MKKIYMALALLLVILFCQACAIADSEVVESEGTPVMDEGVAW